MKLEFIDIAGEEVAFVVLECTECGEGITIREREVKTTRPVRCSLCKHSRYLSYREYITMTDQFAAELLEHTVIKFGGGRSRHFKTLN